MPKPLHLPGSDVDWARGRLIYDTGQDPNPAMLGPTQLLVSLGVIKGQPGSTGPERSLWTIQVLPETLARRIVFWPERYQQSAIDPRHDWQTALEQTLARRTGAR